MSKAMKALVGFFDSQRIKLSPEGFDIDLIPVHMRQRLEDWLGCDDKELKFIWLQGPLNLAEDHQNSMSILAAKLVELACEEKQRDDTLMSYFCSTSRQDPRQGNPSGEAEGVVSLVYALMHQLLAGIHSFHSTHASRQSELSVLEQRISGLDGTVRTWSEALSAFDEAVRLVAPGALCIIDGLHWLDGRDTDDLLCDFVGHLRKTRFKVVFTTNGRSGALLKQMEGRECVEMDEE